MSKEILDQIRAGLELQIKQVIAEDGIPQLYVHEVTQSYLLLQILDKLGKIHHELGMLYVKVDNIDSRLEDFLSEEDSE